MSSLGFPQKYDIFLGIPMSSLGFRIKQWLFLDFPEQKVVTILGSIDIFIFWWEFLLINYHFLGKSQCQKGHIFLTKLHMGSQKPSTLYLLNSFNILTTKGEVNASTRLLDFLVLKFILPHSISCSSLHRIASTASVLGLSRVRSSMNVRIGGSSSSPSNSIPGPAFSAALITISIASTKIGPRFSNRKSPWPRWFFIGKLVPRV